MAPSTRRNVGCQTKPASVIVCFAPLGAQPHSPAISGEISLARAARHLIQRCPHFNREANANGFFQGVPQGDSRSSSVDHTVSTQAIPYQARERLHGG